MNNDFYISSCMSIPFGGFKIKTKNDVKIFAEKCMCKGGMYVLNINEETQFVFHKDKDGEISVDFRSGDLKDIFNPSIEVASTKYADGRTTAPEFGSYLCNGNCSRCHYNNEGCWQLKNGESVVFPAH